MRRVKPTANAVVEYVAGLGTVLTMIAIGVSPIYWAPGTPAYQISQDAQTVLKLAAIILFAYILAKFAARHMPGSGNRNSRSNLRN